MDYSKDIVIGNGIQGPFDHLLKLKSNVHSSPRQHVFDPSDLFLYAVTDSGMNRKWGHSITDAVKAAIEGGATIVQLRFAALHMCLLSFSSTMFDHNFWKDINVSICELLWLA